MCGIAGALNRPDFPAETVKRALAHRGPDDAGVFQDTTATLLHTRLSIVDIRGGHQPMRQGSLALVFNGEIYNHLRLRERLADHAAFTTHSDTETFLHLLRVHGPEGLLEVDGMFAFALWDEAKKELLLARDRAGKKPLYYHIQGNRFAFFSEIGAARAALPLTINDDAVAAYLRMGFLPPPYTVYRDLMELPPGSWLRFNAATGAIEQGRYFDIGDYYHRRAAPLSDEARCAQLEETLEEAVRSRLLSSDLEVGAFLSGGIDSGLVTALAAKHRPGLKTFTVRFPHGYDESPLAAQVASHLGTDHRVIDIDMDLKRDIETILKGYGEPFFDSSAIPSYYVSRAAKQEVTVILNGDGADELFGGYRRYVPAAQDLYRRLAPFSFLTRLLPSPADKRRLYSHLYRLLETAGARTPLEYYLRSTVDIAEGLYDLGPNPILEAANHRLAAIFEDTALSPADRMMRADFDFLLPGDLLVKMDIATMSHALEGRSPFLSKGILELAPTLPPSSKIRGKRTKWILRELAKKHLPPALFSQPKRGFEVPLAHWIDHDLRSQIHDALGPGAYCRTFLPDRLIDGILTGKHPVPKEKRARFLWSLFALEVWKRNQ